MKGSFIALLVSRHIAFTHGKKPSAKPFLAELKKNETRWQKTAGVSSKEVRSAYELLEFCDALSLLICQNLVPPQGRKVEISTGPTGKIYELLSDNGSLVVLPWPFEIDAFTADFEYRNLKNLTFKNDNEFRKVFRKSTARKVIVEFKKR